MHTGSVKNESHVIQLDTRAIQKAIMRSYCHDISAEILAEINEVINAAMEYLDFFQTFQPTDDELNYAMHLLNMDVLELFTDEYVRNNPHFKYTSGRPDTVNNIVKILHECGIFVSCDTVSSWRREKYRLIDSWTLARILELIHISPNTSQQLLFTHILIQRKLREKKNESNILSLSDYLIVSHIVMCCHDLLVRGPCAA